jgi:hypothetical protein
VVEQGVESRGAMATCQTTGGKHRAALLHRAKLFSKQKRKPTQRNHHLLQRYGTSRDLVLLEVGICLTHQTTIPSMRGWKTILGT